MSFSYRHPQSKVFNYEQHTNDRLQANAMNTGASVNTPAAATGVGAGFDLQPQYSMYSPFRSNESRKDYHVKFNNAIAQRGLNQPEIAVRGNHDQCGLRFSIGRRLDGKDVDVICSLGSQDSSSMCIDILKLNSIGIKLLNKGLVNSQ